MTFDPTPAQQKMLDFVAASHRGTLATLRRDGRPQLSNVSYVYQPELDLVRISVTAGRAKTRNLDRDSRASLHVSSRDFWTWAVIDGTAELTAVAAAPNDPTVDELVEVYRLIAGDHPDWDEFRQAMVDEGRQVIRLRPAHVYGTLS